MWRHQCHDVNMTLVLSRRITGIGEKRDIELPCTALYLYLLVAGRHSQCNWLLPGKKKKNINMTNTFVVLSS